MRPIRLEIEGLQSFEKKQVIDFEKLTEYGLFGIFGETGSGKSTILDAITLAIYGEIVRISGRGRSEDRLDDLLNINSKRIRVQFEFQLGKDNYIIERSVKCKAGKRELGAKKHKMIKNGDVIAVKDGEIKTEIQNIIGLTMDDFTRSVVLPQGKFSDFLKLSGKDRTEMLERLFNLEEYGKRLYAKVKSNMKTYSEGMKSIADQIKGKGEEISEEILDKKLEERKALEKDQKKNLSEMDTAVKVFTEIEKIVNTQKEMEGEEEKKDELETQRELFSKKTLKLEKARAASLLSEEYKVYQKEKSAETSHKINHQNVLSSLKAAENSIEEVNTQLNLLKTNSDIFQNKLKEKKVFREEQETSAKLSKNFEKYQDNHGNLSILNKSITVLEGEKKDYSSQIGHLEEELKGESVKLANLKAVDTSHILIKEQEIAVLNIAQVKEMESEVKVLNDRIKSETASSEMLKKTIENNSKTLLELKDSEKKFFAAKMAKDLLEGDKCPVCGSTHHPEPAHSTIGELGDIEKDIQVLENKLDIDKQKLAKIDLPRLQNDADNIHTKLKGRSAEALGRVKETLEREVKVLKQEKQSFETTHRALSESINLLSEKLEYLKICRGKTEAALTLKKEDFSRISEIQRETVDTIKNINISFIDDQVADTHEIEKYLQSITIRLDQVEKLEKKIAEIGEKKDKFEEEAAFKNAEKTSLQLKERELLVSLETQNKLVQNLWDNLKKKLIESSFDSVEAMEDAVLTPEKINLIEEELINYNKALEANKLKLEELIKKLGEKKVSHEEFLEARSRVETLNFQLGKINKNIGVYENEIDRIKKELVNIQGLLKKRKTLEAEYSKYEELEKLFKGNKFVDFLALSKIKNIARLASVRLTKISNGRYSLSTDSGGNFLIVDNFNGGETRRTATLSGGESFLVSLSLALALSSQIQLKGKTQLEFFFLDEGFGTLDSSLLDRVITSLETLRQEERIKVGIITHVEGLKERIPRKIMVSSAISGVKGSTVELA